MSTKRTCRQAGPLRVLWLAALLFAFLYTHAAGADSASAHVTGGAVTVPHLAPADTSDAHDHDAQQHDRRDDDGGGGGHSHPAEACASGHPQQGCDLPHPTATTLRAPFSAATAPQRWTQIRPGGLPSLHSSLSSVVQQV
ncbi:hypothetical protein [Streptomyces sp. NPDC051183]|uniref:hypothetical protein n=1 Tax=unclassified Streptomyces TaxID=2593676 RepID=UPI0034228221